MGMPGFSGFIAEFPIFVGLWNGEPSWLWHNYVWVAIIASVSIVITASYIIRIIQRVFFGNLPAEYEGHVHDASVLDKVALVFLSAIMVSLGVLPILMVPWVQSGVNNIMRLLGGA
jgi:NADH-quinone oxidoreductase subunit M